MSKIIQLPGAPTLQGEAVQSVVYMLEQLLDQAKDGKIRSMAVAFVDDKADVKTNWENEENFFKLMGAVSYLSHRMYKEAK